MKPYAEKFYKSKQWQDCREGYLRSKGFLCERCKAKGIIKPAVIVHHKTYITPDNINDASVTLNYNNLEALCIECHNDEHIAREKKKKRYNIGKNGEVEIKTTPPYQVKGQRNGRPREKEYRKTENKS
jgi:5-methylcytosine-specific restriction endonuclease McrA